MENTSTAPMEQPHRMSIGTGTSANAGAQPPYYGMPGSQAQQMPPPAYYGPYAPPPRTGSGCLKTILNILLILIVIILLVTVLPATLVVSMLSGTGTLSMDDENALQKTVVRSGNTEENVVVIDVKGVISAERQLNSRTSQIPMMLKLLRKDPTVKAIVLDMDTPGGEVVAADKIHQEIQACRNKGIPVITCMNSMAASGGYYIAAGTDWIFANRMTLTGSIGVIMSSVNFKELGDKIGVKPVVFKSGDMKDSMSPFRAMSESEKKYFQDMIQETFREFALIVATGRSKHFASPEDVMKAPFADGRVVSGRTAQQLGLVDQLGSLDDAIDKAIELAGCDSPQVIHCEKTVGFLDQLLMMSAKVPLQVNVSGLPKVSVRPGHMYFLAPECIAEWN